jgi:hypothetical protein
MISHLDFQLNHKVMLSLIFLFKGSYLFHLIKKKKGKKENKSNKLQYSSMTKSLNKLGITAFNKPTANIILNI